MSLPAEQSAPAPAGLNPLRELIHRLRRAEAALQAGPGDESLNADGGLQALLGEAQAALLEFEAHQAQLRRAEQIVTQSERRFRALIENSADAVSLLSLDGRLIYVSPAAPRILGYSAEELIGRSVFELMHPDDMGYVSAAFAEVLAQPGASVTAEYRMRHGDGSWRWLEGTGTNLLDEPGVQAIVANYRDITERHDAQAALEAQHAEIRAMTQQLWQAAKLATMGELTASIAHELNNPLATISLRVESVLRQLPAADAHRRPLEVVQQETERMAALVSSLLHLSRRRQSAISTLDAREEVASALELMHHHLAERDITVTQSLASDTPPLLADRQQLRQVFLNLLTNAADAMPGGGTLAVRVAGARLENGLDGVSIELADTGAGMSPETLARVWEPFFTTKDEGLGTGLGLSICRRILQEHGGTIELTSQPGQGTTARMLLPTAPPQGGSGSLLLEDRPR